MQNELDSIHSLMLKATHAVKVDLRSLINTDYKLMKVEDYNLILNQRYNSNNWIRPFLTAFFLSNDSKIEIDNYTRILSSIELFNISTYQSNLCFDSKIDDSLKFNQYIYSMLSYDTAVNSIFEINENLLCQELKSIIAAEIRKCNTITYRGQLKDLNDLNIDKIGAYCNEENFLKDYIYRCKLISNSIPLCAKVGLILSKCNNKSLEIIYNAMEFFGVLIQIVNDISDCLKVHGNAENTKRYSDLYNGKLTLPLYMFYKQNNISSILQLQQMSKKHLDSLFSGFFQNDSNTAYLSVFLSKLWKEFVSGINSSGYNFKGLCAYLYSFIFRTKYLHKNIKSV